MVCKTHKFKPSKPNPPWKNDQEPSRKQEERKWVIPDLPSWWGLRGASLAWCWVGGTGFDRTMDARFRAQEGAWSCHYRRPKLEPCVGSLTSASRRDGTQWSLLLRSCISLSALLGCRLDLLEPPTPFSTTTFWVCGVFGQNGRDEVVRERVEISWGSRRREEEYEREEWEVRMYLKEDWEGAKETVTYTLRFHLHMLLALWLAMCGGTVLVFWGW